MNKRRVRSTRRQVDRIVMSMGCLSPRKLAQHFCLIGLFSKQFVYISVTFPRFFPQLNFVLEWIQLITIDDGKEKGQEFRDSFSIVGSIKMGSCSLHGDK